MIDDVRRKLRGDDGTATCELVTYLPAPKEKRGLWLGGTQPHIDGLKTTKKLRECYDRPAENRFCGVVYGEGILVIGLQVVATDGHALDASNHKSILAFITFKLQAGDAYVLTEELAGRISVAARARGLHCDAVRVVHGVFAVAAKRVLVNITARI